MRKMDEAWIVLSAEILFAEVCSHLIAIAFGIPSIYGEMTLMREPNKAEITWM